jgi:hypothetical protein
MKKETLTVETHENGTVIYRNADVDFHNSHGPAIVWGHGGKWYYIKGQLHNENGPAIVHADGRRAYYINDKKLTEAEFKTWRNQQTAPLHNKTKVIDGIEYKLTAI